MQGLDLTPRYRREASSVGRLQPIDLAEVSKPSRIRAHIYSLECVCFDRGIGELHWLVTCRAERSTGLLACMTQKGRQTPELVSYTGGRGGLEWGGVGTVLRKVDGIKVGTNNSSARWSSMSKGGFDPSYVEGTKPRRCHGVSRR